MKRPGWKFFLTILVLLVIPVIAWPLLNNGDDDDHNFRFNTVTRGNISETITANGTLNPVLLVNVGTQVSGKITQVYVQVNDQVKKDQLLAEMDPAILEAQLRQTQNSYETARTAFEQSTRDLERTRTLTQKDYLSKADLERAQQSYRVAENSFNSAKTQVDRDKVNLGYTKITSPIDGVVISQDVTIGQTVAANFQTPNLFKIAGDLTKMKIDVSFSEADISKIKLNMPVTFAVDAFPDRTFNGEVQTINLNPLTTMGVVTYSVTVAVDNPDKLLLPGMTAYITVTLSKKKDVLRVPPAALHFVPPVEQVNPLQRLLQGRMGARTPLPTKKLTHEGNRFTIFLLKNDEAVPIEIETGIANESNVEVLSGDVAEGDKVIIGLKPKKK